MTKTLNWRYVVKVLGMFILFEIAFLLVSTGVSIFYGEDDLNAFICTIMLSAVIAAICLLTGKNSPSVLGRKESYLIVSSVWVVFSLIGMLPFMLSGYIPSAADAFFETMSGFTTTGATILNNIEDLPHGLLFWRSMTQWVGGMGIVVLYLAVLPMLNTGTQMFSAESPGPQVTKLRPRIKETARRLWGMYLIFTLAETVMLVVFGMSLFDALCHSFSTLATGGFSTKQASVAYWDSPAIDYTITLFMIIGGTNFALMYSAVVKRSSRQIFKDEEFKAYLWIIGIATAIIFLSLLNDNGISSFASVEKSFRDSLFQVATLVTTTGFATADYMQWQPMTLVVIAFLMLFGSCANSTSGGIKIIRILVTAKNAFLEFKRLIHPKAVVPVRINGHVVPEYVVNGILAFVTIYIVVVSLSVLLLSIIGMEVSEAIGGVLTCIGNVGPGFGDQGPAGSFSGVPVFAKWYLSFLMLLGRLELFTLLLMCTPAFWKR